MRYIKKLTIKNFQGYKKEVIEFSPGLNLLTGSSDAGKSSILRAIIFVLHNYPKNDTMIHLGTTEANVTIEFSDGIKVSRIKGKKSNSYVVVDANGNKTTYDKIDKTIPEEVSKCLNFPPEDSLNGFISYADQFDKMFLLDLSPTELPRSLSILTGIEVLEDSANQMMQKYRGLDKKNKNDSDELKKLSVELESLSFIEDFQEKTDALNNKINQLESLQSKYDLLSTFSTDSVDDINKKHTIFSGFIDCLEKLNEKINNMKNLLSDYEKMFFLSENNNFEIIEIESSFFDQLNITIDRMNLIKEKINQYSSMSNISSEYKQLNLEGKEKSDKRKQTLKNLEEATYELNTFKKYLSDNNLQCDKCGSILA